MKKLELQKLIEEVISENLEEIKRSLSYNKENNPEPLDNDINNSTFLTPQGKMMASLSVKPYWKDGGESQRKAQAYLRKKLR